jgi:hypothetical protein
MAPDYESGPLTVNLAVAFLTDMLLTDGLTNILHGTPSSDDTNILDSAAKYLRTTRDPSSPLTPSSSRRTSSNSG